MNKHGLPRYVSMFVDRHGKPHYRFRKTGFKAVMLPSDPRSRAFEQAYAAALARDAEPIAASRTLPGSMSAAIVAYYESADWKQLRPLTQRQRRNILERFRASTSPGSLTPYGDRPLAAFEKRHLHQLMDARSGKPHAANNLLKTLRALFRFALDRNLVRADPAHLVKPLRVQSAGFHTWSEAEITAYENCHPLGTPARLALALLLYTAQRRSDVVRMGPQHLRGGFLSVVQSKTGTALKIPVTQPLQAAIDAAPVGHLAFLVTEHGKPFSAAGFGNKFRDWCNQAKLPPGCSAHGLRKSAATRLANAGLSAHAVAAITGHKSLAEVQRYTRAADQERLAASAAEALSGPMQVRLLSNQPPASVKQAPDAAKIREKK